MSQSENVHTIAQFPQHMPVDPDKATRTLFVPENGSLYATRTIIESFQPMDDIYSIDRLDTFRYMARSVMRLGIGVDAAFMHSADDAYSRDVVLVMSPLNDGKPESEPEKIHRYVSDPSAISTRAAQPNSWGPATKLWTDYMLGQALGANMPRLQIFSRDIPALTPQERRRVSGGDMLPFGRLAVAGLEAANEVMNK